MMPRRRSAIENSRLRRNVIPRPREAATSRAGLNIVDCRPSIRFTSRDPEPCEAMEEPEYTPASYGLAYEALQRWVRGSEERSAAEVRLRRERREGPPREALRGGA